MHNKHSTSAVITLFVAASSVIAGAPLPLHRPRGALAEAPISYGKRTARPGGGHHVFGRGYVGEGVSIGGNASESTKLDSRDLFALNSPKSLLARRLRAKHRNRRVSKDAVFAHDGVNRQAGVNVPISTLSPTYKETSNLGSHSSDLSAHAVPGSSTSSLLGLDGLEGLLGERNNLLDGYGTPTSNLENGYGSLPELDALSSLTGGLSGGSGGLLGKRNDLLDGYGTPTSNLENGYGSLPELDSLTGLLSGVGLKRADLLDGYGTPTSNLENGYGSLSSLLDPLDLTSLGLAKKMAARTPRPSAKGVATSTPSERDDSLGGLSSFSSITDLLSLDSLGLREEKDDSKAGLVDRSFSVAGIKIPDGLDTLSDLGLSSLSASSLDGRSYSVAGIQVPDGLDTVSDLGLAKRTFLNTPSKLDGYALMRRTTLGDAIGVPIIGAADSPVLDSVVVPMIGATSATSTTADISPAPLAVPAHPSPPPPSVPSNQQLHKQTHKGHEHRESKRSAQARCELPTYRFAPSYCLV